MAFTTTWIIHRNGNIYNILIFYNYKEEETNVLNISSVHSCVFFFSLQEKRGPLLHCLARVLQLFDVSVKVRLNLTVWVWLAQFLLACTPSVELCVAVAGGCH